MSTLQEISPLCAELMRLAQTHVDSARQLYSMTFDYSPDSLGWVDDVITRFHADGNMPEDRVLPFGAYVGEAIRRSLGGNWIQDERGVALLERIAIQIAESSGGFLGFGSKISKDEAKSIAGIAVILGIAQVEE